MAGNGQGVTLPISVQIANLQEVAAQLKKFADTNVLSDSISGKKINSELTKVLNTLTQIEVKAKSAFKTNADFSGLDKDISKIELNLEHVQTVISNLSFKDLKLPSGTETQIADLTARINELKAGLATFKSAQMDKLTSNGTFLVDLEKAFPKKSTQLLEKDYDSLYLAVKNGMTRINQEINRQNTVLEESRARVTQNMSGKANFTALGALDWLEAAFKAFPKNGKLNAQQEMLQKYMDVGELTNGQQGFTKFKAGGYTGLMSLLQKQFEFTPDQMNEIQRKVKEATEKASETAKTTAFATLRKMATDKNYGAQVLTGSAYDAAKQASDTYTRQRADVATQESKLGNLNSQMEGMTAAWEALKSVQGDVEAQTAAVTAALAAPQGELDGLQASILNLVQTNPQLAASFQQANAELARLQQVSNAGKQQLTDLDNTLNKLQGVSNFITRYLGIYAIVRKVSTAVRNAFNNIKELDKNITNIAVVTNMSQEDLWGKIGEYTAMAQQFGVATKDVYTVSQIFYQQGLQTNQVMSLTTETLKMAKISGMDYSSAANAMTVAIRAFKIEMTDAQSVTDTYSALAAKFAVSSAEIANAMEKTASSAANVGMSLQSTSAFMSVMIQTTRESAQNIGSALKSIISRYGEMKASPDKLLNVDGEDVAFNKVDTALQSIGISIKDASGQFRDFDDVIMELAQKWDSLDNNTQRYIATIMAGNRQQSRFIALVSNYDELNRAMSVASNAENASIVQTAKTMDSLESKAQQLKNAFAQLYLDLHFEDGLKGLYDTLTRILKTIGKLGIIKGVIPSLMNVIGFGTGLKGAVTGAKNYITAKKSAVQVDMSKAQRDAETINRTLAQKVIKEIELQVKNKEELDNLQNKLNQPPQQPPQQPTQPIPPTQPTPPVAPTGASTAQPTMSQNEFYSLFGAAYQQNLLNTPEGRANLLAQLGVATGTEKYQTMNAMMGDMSGISEASLTGAVAQLYSVFSGMSGAAGAVDGLSGSAGGAAGAIDSLSSSAGSATGAIDGVSSAAENAGGSLEQTVSGAESAEQGLEQVGDASQQAAAQVESSAQQNSNALITSAARIESGAQLFEVSLQQAGMTWEQLNALLNGTGVTINSLQSLLTLLNSGMSTASGQVNLLGAAAESSAYSVNRLGIGAGGHTGLITTGQRQSGYVVGYDEHGNPIMGSIMGGGTTGGNTGGETPPINLDKFSFKNNQWGNGKGFSNARAWASAGSIVARMAGTAIAAYGASYQDKSDDELFGRQVEKSKILTGLGNGLSMAGTGASIGMAFGPWGAAIGAAAGFIAGGLPAILDGLEKTDRERLALEKEEASKASETNLKQQAKAVDLSSSIDNLKKLRSIMYDSADGIKNYQDAMNTLGQEYPNLISAYDSAGNAIIDLETAEQYLINVRAEAARTARASAVAEAKAARTQLGILEDERSAIEAQLLNPTSTNAIEGGITKNGVLTSGVFYIAEDRGPNAIVHGIYGNTSGVAAPGGENAAPVNYPVVDDFNRVFEALLALDDLSGLPDNVAEIVKYYQDHPDETISKQDFITLGMHMAENVDSNRNAWGATGYHMPNGNAIQFDSVALKLDNGDWSGSFVREFINKANTEFDYKDAVAAMNKYFADNHEALGINEVADGNYTKVIFGWTENTTLTAQKILDAYAEIDQMVTAYNKKVEALNKASGLALAEEGLNNYLELTDTLPTKKATTMQSSKIFSSLISQTLEAEAKKHKDSNGNFYADAATWADEKLGNQAEYEVFRQNAVIEMADWVNSITQAQLEAFVKMTSSMTEYLSADEILAQFNIDENSDLGKSIIAQFAADNLANRNRILRTVYATDKDGNILYDEDGNTMLNKDLTGLAGYDDAGVTEDKVKTISDLITGTEDESAAIISQYADYFASQISAINKLAEQGYTELASTRLTALYELAGKLAEIDDSQTQQDLFGIITNIDFSSYKSIKSAQKRLQTYKNAHPEYAMEIDSMYQELIDAENDLVYNVNTLAAELTAEIVDAAKEIDTVLTTNKSGLDLSKAITELEKINANNAEKDWSFDELFTYDAALGKFVYTQRGLMEAIATREKELEESATHLRKVADEYETTIFPSFEGKEEDKLPVMGEINAFDKIDRTVTRDREGMEIFLKAKGIALDSRMDRVLDTLDETSKDGFYTVQEVIDAYNAPFESAAEIMELIEDNIDIPEDMGPEYQALAAEFYSSQEYTVKSWKNFLIFLQKKSESSKEAAAAADALNDAYKSNEKNLIYSSIDWDKLALGTDYTGTNAMLTQELAKQIGLMEEYDTGKKDAAGQAIKAWRWKDNQEVGWEQILDSYLDTLYDDIYGTDDAINAIEDEAERTKKLTEKNNAKTAAKAAMAGKLNSSRQAQVSNAITDILAGPGKELSADTIALLQESDLYGKAFTIDTDTSELKVIAESGYDNISIALAEYNKAVLEGTIGSLEDQNNKYSEIITATYKKDSAAETLLSAGSKLDFGVINTTFTNLGLKLDDYWDAENKKWKEKLFTIQKDGEEIQLKLEDVFSTDAFGKTTIKDWDTYLAWLESEGIKISEMDAATLAKYRRAYIDSIISNENELDLDKNAATQISNLSNAKIGDRINITEIKGLLGKTEDEILIASEEELNGYISLLESYLSNTEWVANNADQAEAIRNAVASWKTKFNQNDAWKGVIAENVSYSAAETLQTALGRKGEGSAEDFMESLGFYWDSFTKQFIAGEDAIARISEELRNTPIENTEARNSLQALIDNLEDTQKYKSMKTLQEVLSNYNNITNEQIAAFNTQFEGIDLHKFITKDITGKQTLNVSALRAAMKGMGQDINELFGEEIASIMDTNMSNLTSAANYAIEGTTSVADMQKFLKNYKDLTGVSLTNAFSYNDIIDAWTLDPQVLQSYVQAQGQELVNLGLLNSEDLNKYVNDNVQKKLAENIDVGAFLDAENKSNEGEAYKTLKNALVTYLKSSDEVFENARAAYIKAKAAEKTDITEMEEAAKAASEASADEITEYYIDQLKQGGAAAVEVMRAVAKAQGKELTAADVESAYRSEVSQLEDAFDQLSYGVGSLISGQAKAIFDAVDKTGKYHTEIDDTTAVITATLEEISVVYQEYYNMLLQSGEATLAAVNEAKAKILETQNGNATEQAAIDALGDASGMTYTAFASILSNAGIELTDELMKQLTTDKVIEAMGGNKMRILDFNRFAQGMGWKFDSEEYLSAYKTFNDGLIELNRKTEKDITEELKGLEEAKPGDWINLSSFSHALSKKIVTHVATDIDNQINEWEVGSTHRSTALYDLNTKLIPFGAQIVDGILKLSDNANLLEIAESIKDAAASAELDLKDGFQELADAIKNILKAYVDAITGGIEGGLTNVEASDLASKARDLGVSHIDFTETAEGLKLSEQSAIALYSALKQVDGLQATLVFDKLKNSLEEANENFASSSALVNYIVRTRRELNNADSNVSDARLQQYEAELAVAQEILAVRATQEDNSFNFMSNDIPAAQKNPLNYAKNWTQAFQAIRDAYKVKKGGKTGFIDYEDWYNIATEMNNIAGITGQKIKLGALELDGSLEAASKAIQAGCDSLTSVDTGDLKVELGSIGIGIKSGAEAMQDSVTAGIQAAAKSQVKMLDGLIAMLEIIVAMEQLGDITGDDTQIDLGDIFVTSDANGKVLDEITEFTDGFDKARNKLLDYVKSNKELQERLDNTQVNFNGKMRSMMDMLGDGQTKQELFDNLFGGLTGDDKRKAQEAYQTMLNGLYQAAISGDYDLDDIAASVQKVLKQSGVDVSEFVFNVMEDGKIVRTLTFVGETAIEIDYTDEDARKAVDAYLNSNKYAKDQAAYTTYVQDALSKYKTGKDGDRTVELDELINLRTVIGIASNEFVISGDDKSGYTGYFDGKKFEGSNKNELLTLMGEAAMYKDEGLDFEVKLNENGKQVIKGKTTISGIDIEVSLDNNGKPQYTYNGKTGSKELIMGLIAKEGRQTETGTYTFTDEGKEYSVKVSRAIGLDLTYSYYNDGEPHYVYDGHDFGGNYDQMYSYMKTSSMLDPDGKGQWEKYWDAASKSYQQKRVIKLSNGVKVETYLTADGGVQTYCTFAGENKMFSLNDESQQRALAAYMEASSMEGFEDISGENAGGKRTVQFRSGGYEIEAEIDITAGTTTYKYTDGETVYTADRLSDLQSYLDVMSGKDLESGDSEKTYTIKKTVKGQVEVEIEIVNGKVGNAQALIDAGAMTAEEITALEAKLAGNKQTLENPVEATASEVKIVTEGADITLDVETLKPEGSFPVEIKASTITIDTSGATPELSNGNGESEGTNGLTVDLTGVITSYINGESTPDELVNGLSAIVATYTNSGDPNTLVTALSAIVQLYSNGGDPNTLVAALSAIITAYDNTADPNSLVAALCAYITEYDDSGATKPTLDDLTQFISSINTEGADAALAAWRAQQEANALRIPIEQGNDRRPEREPGTPPTWYGNGETDQMIYSREFSDWAGEIAQHIYQLPEAGEHSGEFQYIPQYGQTYNGPELPEGWTIGQDGYLYTNNIPTTMYERQGLDGGWEFATPEGETVTLTGEISELDTGAVEGETIDVTGNINPETGEGFEVEDIDLDANIELDTSEAEEGISELQGSAEEGATMPIDGDTSEGESKLKGFQGNINASSGQVKITADATSAYSTLQTLKNSINSAKGTVTINAVKGTSAKGNVALAGGNARASGQSTLMGELGPELVVSNGRYFIVGQGGAEFVNLASDAIVFNHKQTESLLNNGKSSRGKPITNEKNAISWAKGNIHGGPAKAGAAAALAALKQLRAQWASLAQLSAKDLAGKGGGGGGGGGNKQFIKDLEKWYNWLQKIAQLEKDINYYEAERNRISSEWAPNGHEYYNSQKNSLAALQEELAVQNDLTKSQEEYFNKRRAEMNEKSNPFTALYTFDENGQLKYKDGALKKLSDISSRDPNTGKPYKTDKEQYEAILAMNPKFAEYMKYDNSGKEIEKDDYNAMVQAFWDKIDSDKEEMQSLHDSVEDGYLKLEELQQQQNELLKEMRDNQMDLEQKVYDAIVDMRERAIDELKDTKDAIEDQNEKFITGLTDALQKEQTMYSNAESREDLEKLRRKRDVLVRSGGSAAEIASLNEQISDQEKAVYFDKQQEEIDAIQAASDKQIEKLEAQINLETEILDYQKKYGLLWSEVTDIMSKSPEEIARFISENDQDYWNKSPVATADALNQLIFQSEQWTSYRDDGAALANNVDLIKKKVVGESDSSTPSDSGDSNPPSEGSNPPSSGTENPNGWKSANWVSDGAGVGHHRHIVYNNGKTKDTDVEPHTWEKYGASYRCKVCKQVATHYTPITSTPQEEKPQKPSTGGCFIAGTKIIMADGTIKNIEDIKVNEIVMAYNDITNIFEPRLVTKSYIHHNTPRVLEMTFSNGIVLGITPGHPILTTNGWKSRDIENSLYEHGVVASWLEIGDEIISYDENVFVISIKELTIPTNYDTYNIEVESCHTFLAEGLVVHNMKVAYDTGGMVKNDGLAYVHANEAVLNAEQTRILRNNILGHKSNSLVNLLASYNDAYKGLSSNAYDSISNNSSTSTQIDKAEINLNIDKLANDYDAKRAANTIMDEMLRIASKTSANNSVRR